MTTKTEQCSWGKIADVLADGGEELAPLLASMARFRDETVLRVTAPYGTPIISEGRFHWGLADDLRSLQPDYQGAPVPLGLVVSKSIELSTAITFPGDGNGPVSRAIPAYLITRGEFFGLFENFAQDLKQNPVNGFAGGTSLLVLPPLGRHKDVTAFARSIKWTCPRGLRENIKPTKSSTWDFGAFFAAMLEAVHCEWRLDMAIFPKPLLEKMRGDAAISLCLQGLTLRQLAVAHERVLSMMEMLTSRTRPYQEDVISIRQIERGNRPGFAPVLGTDVDQEILPARELFGLLTGKEHGLFRERREPPTAEDNEESSKEASDEIASPDIDAAVSVADDGKISDYHPAIFRPSLPTEPFYYFLRRPLAFQSEREIRMEQRALDVAADLRSADKHLSFTLLHDPQDLEAVLREQAEVQRLHDGPPVRLGASQFVAAGVIRVAPRVREAKFR